MNDPTRVRLMFRTVAFAEAFSWLGLLIGMYVKYGTDSADETGVHVFGPIHGAIFTLFLISVLLARNTFGWSLRTTVLAAAAAVPPFATVLFEVLADRGGLLGAAGAEPVKTS